MVSEELGIIIEKLKHQGEMAFQEGATEEQIVAFEAAHDFHLPSKYKECLITLKNMVGFMESSLVY